MVKTRHGTKEVSPKEDIKDETIRTSARRHRGQADAWQHEKKKEERKEKTYHMYNGSVDEKKMHLRSSEQEEVRRNLRYSRMRGRFSKGERSYQNRSTRSGYIERRKCDHNSHNEEDDGHERRRSGRLRRGLYGSLNERMICYDPHYQKDKVDKSGDEDSEEEREHEKSMYDFVKKHQRQVSITPQKRRKSSPHSNYDLENSEDTAEEVEEGEEEDDAEEEEMEEQEGQEDESQSAAAYSLRKTKPVTKRYIAPPMSVKTRKRTVSALYAVPHSPVHKASHKRIPQHSAPHHRTRKRVFGERRKHYGSSTSSSSGDSDDEVRFEKRKRKSMALARSRCLPMNFAATDVIGLIKDRERARGRGNVGSSLADIEPMSVDSKVTFESIGGLDRHIRALKEMVVFPLMYPEVFEKFKISPPRGVLFHGPPGTGKTLVARALANECGLGGHKVAFFMRKGADCLSKWVGESERQLRLLFDQAYAMRPSIIFFDEIDGLAPVRSTRQDQIHSSIVSTLLALMDGLDARGEIVVIGATNRIDSIDPALRRPGRFDREFLFTLPNCKARRQILEIHTKDWQPKLSKPFQTELADYTVGYCGADLKALCTEAALFALRRRYPQIYGTNSKLMIDVDDVRVSAKDFRNAIGTITPASQRAVVSPGRALEINVKPLLQTTLEEILSKVRSLFSPATLKDSAKETDSSTGSRGSFTSAGHMADDDDLSSEDDEQSVNIFEPAGFGRSTRRIQRLSSPPPEPPEHGFLHVFNPRRAFGVPHRPRFILAGPESNGQATHLAPAVLYAMEHLTVHVMDLPALFGVSARVPEEACAQIFREARRTAPCVIYLPHISTWWNSIGETTRATFVTLLDDLPPSAAILLMATSNSPFDYLPDRVRSLFCENASEVYEVQPPKKAEREEFFKPLISHALQHRKTGTRQRPKRILENLPVAPTPQVRQLNDAEVAELRKQEENTLRELRLFLRQITWKLLADRKFKEFSKPVDLDEVPDYLDVIKNPMDLSTVMTRINSHYYQNCAQYLEDIDLITNNCLEYNPDRDQFDRLLRNRACELRDTAYAMVEADLDPEFEKMCIEIVKSRLERGETRGFNAPSYVRCLQKNPNPLRATNSLSLNNKAAECWKRRSDEVQNSCLTLDTERPATADADLAGVRSSKRLKGVDAPSLEYSGVPLERRLTRERQSSTLSSRTADEETKDAKRVKRTAVAENGCSSVIVQDVDIVEQASLNLGLGTNSDANKQTASITTEENKDQETEKETTAETDNGSDLNKTLISGDRAEEYLGTSGSELHLTLEQTSVRDAGKCLEETDEKEAIIENEEKMKESDKTGALEVLIPHSSVQEQELEPERRMTKELSPQDIGRSELPERAGNDPLLEEEKAKLEEALDHLVEKTAGSSVTSLQKIYSSVSKLIYLHQRRENKALLISEIKNFISRL